MSDNDTNATTLVSAVIDPYTREQLDLIKRVIAPDTSDDEFKLFMEVARRTGLDPFSKQIYAIMRWDGRAGRNKMTIQTSVDGYLALAERTGEMAGVDDILFEPDTGEHPERATATVYRIVKGQRVPFTYTARWTEYVQKDKSGKPTGMWERMAFTMLGKCALTRALRLGFPAQLGGIYTAEEMSQADTSEPTTPVARITEVDESERQPQQATHAPQTAPTPTPLRPVAKPTPAQRASDDLSAQRVPADQQCDLFNRLQDVFAFSGSNAMDAWLSERIRAADTPRGAIGAIKLRKGHADINMAEQSAILAILDAHSRVSAGGRH